MDVHSTDTSSGLLRRQLFHRQLTSLWKHRSYPLHWLSTRKDTRHIEHRFLLLFLRIGLTHEIHCVFWVDCSKTAVIPCILTVDQFWISCGSTGCKLLTGQPILHGNMCKYIDNKNLKIWGELPNARFWKNKYQQHPSYRARGSKRPNWRCMLGF